MSGTGKAEGNIGEKDMRKRSDEERSILCVMEGQRSARSLLGESEDDTGGTVPRTITSPPTG